MADPAVQGDPIAIVGQIIPQIDPMFAFLIVLAVLFLFLALVVGGIFLIAVKKNWLVLSWPYKVTLFKPSGNSIVRFEDRAALLRDEGNRIRFRLQQGGFEFEVPDREYIHPGNFLYGWSATMREFVPLKLNFVGFKKSPDPLVLKKIAACQDPKQRQQLQEEYASRLIEMEAQWRPVVDNATINSTIENTAAIVKATPLKAEWFALLGIGIAVMLIIITFLIFAALQMKQADLSLKSLEVDSARINAETRMADVLNQTTQVNSRLFDILNRTGQTVHTPR